MYCPACGEAQQTHDDLTCEWRFEAGRWIHPEDKHTSQFVRYSDSGCLNDVRFGASDD